MRLFHRLCKSASIAALALATPALADSIHVVTSTADSGAGSLRAALSAAAEAETAATVVILAEGAIMLQSGLRYEGTAPLNLFGNRTEIVTSANDTVLTISQGADLYVRNVSFEGPGSFSIENRPEGAAGKGIFVDLRDDQEGTVRLALENVRVTGVAGHGVHVSDCSLADDCGGGEGGAGDGAPAGIEVFTAGVEIVDVGHGGFDADGLRVDERGPGDIRFTALSSRFADAGADGVELDEGQDGDVIIRVTGSAFEGNGAYCDPSLLIDRLPEVLEAAFEAGAKAEAEIPGPVTNLPDNRCVEREVDLHEDGSVASYAFAIDTDDGFDVDEAGKGSIVAVLERTGFVSNLDQGLDFDEEDAGDINLTLVGTVARDNTDVAYKASEDGKGSVIGAMISAIADGNGGAGVVLEEEDKGDVTVRAHRMRSQFNDGGETGLEVTQEGEGTGTLKVIDSQIAEGIAAEGVVVE